MQLLTLNVLVSTKDQQLIREIDSSLQSVDWDLVTHRHKMEGQRVEHEYMLDLNTNNRDYYDSLKKLISLLLIMQNSNSSGLGDAASILDEYCRTARKSENTYSLEIVGGGSASNLSPDGMK